MDRDYLLLGSILVFVGVIGLTATYGAAGAGILSGATCNCIPSAAARAQELSAILLAFGVAFIPVGWLKSVPSGRARRAPVVVGSGRVFRPPKTSGGMLATGVAVALLGIEVVAVPSILILSNPLLVAEGVALALFGALLAWRGLKPG